MIYSSSGLVHAGYVSVVPVQSCNALMKHFGVMRGFVHELQGLHGPAISIDMSTVVSKYRDTTNDMKRKNVEFQ